MSLPHALLTSLLERPSSGYDLARRFDSSIGYFWHATHQQIYRELGRMQAAGWISSEGAADHSRKRLYQCEPAGATELRRWVAEGGSAPILRDPLLVRLRADAALGDLGLDAQLRARRAEHDSRLTAYRQIEERDFVGHLDRRARVQHGVLLAGIAYEEAGIVWCDQVLAILTATDDQRSEAGAGLA